MNLLTDSSVQQNNQPRASRTHMRPATWWIVTAAIASLLATVVGIYLVSWSRDAHWQWTLTVSLGYLVPVTLAAFYRKRLPMPQIPEWGPSVAVALVGSASILPLLGRGWQLDKLLGTLFGLGIVALILPAYACLLNAALGARAQQDRVVDQAAQKTAPPIPSNGGKDLRALFVSTPAQSFAPDADEKHIGRVEQSGTPAAPLGDTTEQITYLGTISNLFQIERSWPRMLRLVAREISQGTGFETVLIGLVEGKPPMLHNEAIFGLAPSTAERLHQVRFPLAAVQDVMQDEFGISQSYYISGDHDSAWISSLQTFLLAERPPRLREEGASSALKKALDDPGSDLLIVPMYGAAHTLSSMPEQIAGVIILTHQAQRESPAPIVVETLQILAQQTVTALDNHRLYNDLQRRVENLVLINDIGQAITAGLDQENILREVTGASVQLLNGDYSVLYFWDSDHRRLVPQVAHGFSLHRDTLFSPIQLRALARLVVHEGHPVLVSDMDSDPTFSDSTFSPELPLGSVLMVPLVKGSKVSGTLMTGTTRVGAFDYTDQILLSTLADQASVAIQNARLYESIAWRVNQLATLNDLAKTIISSLDIDVILDRIMSKVREALNVEAGSLLMLENGKLEFTVAFGPMNMQLESLELELGQGIAGWVALTGKSVLVGDAKTDERHYAGTDQATGYETRSLLCVPLTGPENRSIGVLEIMNPLDGRTLTRQDQELLESIAAFAVVAIQNAQLYQQTTSHVTDLSRLYKVGKAITSSLDIDDTLQIVVDQTTMLTGAAQSRIVLFDSQTERVTYAVQYGYDETSPITLHSAHELAHQGLAGWVLGEKTPTMSADLANDERMRGVSIREVAGKDAQSMIVAPLLIKGEPIGTLSAVRSKDTEPFTERELGLLNMIAGQAAVAIENAHFFEERKRQITELSILNQTGQALSSTLEPEDLMELIYSQVAQVMDAQNFYIALYDPDQDRVHFPLVYKDGVRQTDPRVEPVPTTDPQTGTESLPVSERQRQRMAEYIIKTKQALWIPNHVHERLAELGIAEPPHPPGVVDHLARSWLGVPILSGDQAPGVIAVQSYEQEDVYDREHLELLIAIAGQASAAIRNAQLYAKVNLMTANLEHLVTERTDALTKANEELTVERDRLNALYLITRELSGSLEPERALNRTLALINRSLQAQQGYVLLRDSASQYLEYVAVAGETSTTVDIGTFPSPKIGDTVQYKSDPGVIGWLMGRGNSMRIGDLQNETRWHIVAHQDRWHRSGLAAPLISGTDVVGAIILFHSEPNHFTVEHQQVLDAIAYQVAIAMSNAEMFSLLREAAERLGKMLRSQQLEAAKSHAILEGVADGVIVTDAIGKIILFNAAAERILRMHRTEIIGCSVSEVSGILSLAGTSWVELTERWGQGVLEPDENILYDERLEVDERVISMRVAPVVRQGAFEGTVSVFRDITKDVEVDRMKSEFVSSISHELRTPMTSVKGYIDLLYNGMAGPISGEQRHFLEVIRNNADRMTLLVNDLLDISSMETGRLKLSIEPIDALNIVNTVLGNYRSEAQKRQQTLINAIETPLPLVCADSTRMTQILTNLVSNAIHYTPDGGTITASAQVVDDLLHIHVQDTGIGIEKEDKSWLFSRFFRADTPLVRAHSGIGLGLAIVKSIVELHGGEIWFESTYGKGSTFSFSLPLASTSTPEKTLREFKTISYRPHDKRILIAESDTSIADLVSLQLRERGGYRLQVERSGREALDHIRNEELRPDLILLDLDLPDIDGLYVLQNILSHRSLSTIPIIALLLSRREHNGNGPGPRVYISKPIQVNHLPDAVDAVLAQGSGQLGSVEGKALIAEDNERLAQWIVEALAQKGLAATVMPDRERVFSTAQADQPVLILLDMKRSDASDYRVFRGPTGCEILRQLKGAPETRNIPILTIARGDFDIEGALTPSGTLEPASDKRDLVVSTLQFLDVPVKVEGLVGEILKVLDDVKDKSQVSSN